MLIEKLNKNDVVTIKLASGEELITRYLGEENDSVRIRMPLQMVLSQMEQSGQGYLSFAPWMLGITDDQELKIKTASIVTMARARKDAAEQYTRVTSPLQQASSSDLPDLGSLNG